MNIDSSIMGTTPWDPFTFNGFRADRAYGEWSGETKYMGTDMMGSTYNPTTFGTLKVQDFLQGREYWRSQHSGDDTAGTSPGGYRYGFAWTYADAFKIWTLGT